MTSIIGGVAAFFVGAALAGATLVGVVSSQTSGPDKAPVDVSNVDGELTSVIEYGSN